MQSDLVKSLRGVICNISNEIVSHPEKYEDLVKNGSSLLGILEANKRWARNVQRINPEFFHNQNEGQHPTMLWIGCSDSRVPPTHITQTKPGDFFVHRNIGNAVHALDLNANAVMQYSIDALKVKHVIVCGHYKCGAVKAGMGKNTGLPIIEQWIANIRNLDDQIHETLDKLDHDMAFDLMCELNSITNARNACLTQVVQNAWKKGQPLTVHGWCYRLSTGIIEDLKFEVNSPDRVEIAYQSAIQDAIQRARYQNFCCVAASKQNLKLVSPHSTKLQRMDPQQMIQERMKRPQNPSIQTQPDSKPQRRHGQTRPVREVESPPIRFVTGPPHRDHWKPDHLAPECSLCGQKFTFFVRKHHCRRCGDVFCKDCCHNTARLDQDVQFHQTGIQSRVCDPCYKESLIPVSAVTEEDKAQEGPGDSLFILVTIDINVDIAETPMMSVPSDWTWSTF
ncbi:hypothetical protein HDV01_006418 [Terramyces sp. JEL0728]|nr:hypothetical protein HDV01_006418 [Terramyces sp. JEL0728]